MPGPPRDRPLPGHAFQVEIDGVALARFQEVSGLGVEVDVIEYRVGDDKVHAPRKLPGLHHVSDVTLKRGITGDLSLWEWVQRTLVGDPDRRAVQIRLIDARAEPVLSFRLHEAWPVAFTGPTLVAGGSQVAVETLVLCHERLEIV